MARPRASYATRAQPPFSQELPVARNAKVPGSKTRQARQAARHAQTRSVPATHRSNRAAAHSKDTAASAVRAPSRRIAEAIASAKIVLRADIPIAKAPLVARPAKTGTSRKKAERASAIRSQRVLQARTSSRRQRRTRPRIARALSALHATSAILRTAKAAQNAHRVIMASVASAKTISRAFALPVDLVRISRTPARTASTVALATGARTVSQFLAVARAYFVPPRARHQRQ